jgi:hypothetical protein
MKDQFPTAPPVDRVLATIHGELSTGRRWVYRLTLLAAGVALAIILSLWLTEPRPLPLRLHLAFAALSSIAAGWIAVLTWILTQKNCPSAMDRLATAWMATVACVTFLVVSLPIALMRGNTLTALSLSVMGIGLLGAALWMLCAAYAFRAKLREKLQELS